MVTRVTIGFFLTMVSSVVVFVDVNILLSYAFSSNLLLSLGIKSTQILMMIAVLPLDGSRVSASRRNRFFLTMVSPVVVSVAVAFYYSYAFSSNLLPSLGINRRRF